MTSIPPRLAVGGGALVWEPPLVLAPMDGVTDPCFRELVAEASGPALGGACTEFVRVTDHPLPVERLARELGPHRLPCPLGLQLMGNHAPALAETAVRAAEAGADHVDLNFGCPAPRVFRSGAGSALLDDPPRLAALVAAVVAAAPLPVTVKIRAGVADDRRLEELVRRIADAGAAAITVHARLKVEPYSAPADWNRLRRAVAASPAPVVGNGSADSAAGVLAMFADTGCAAVMVGRGALADPWVFRAAVERAAGRSPEPVAPAERVAWLRRYAARMLERGASPAQALGRTKQALRAAAQAGRLPHPEGARGLREALRADSLDGLLDPFLAGTRTSP